LAIAHLGYFRAEFVERRRWLTERAYIDLVALSQFLPARRPVRPVSASG
jgi:chromate transporter